MIARATHLDTPRLRLRRATADDAAAVHAIMSHPQAMHYWSTLPHRDIAETRAWLDQVLNADPASNDEFMIEHDGALIGRMGAWKLPEIGFFLHPDHQGKGFALEALEAYQTYIAGRGVAFLTADVDPLNEACLNLLSRAGFRETGRERATYTLGDRVCDSVYLRCELAGG